MFFVNFGIIIGGLALNLLFAEQDSYFIVTDLSSGILDAFPHAIERTMGLEFYVSIWLAGTAVCKLQRTVANTAVMASNYLLAAMSMDRAYVICKPMLNVRRGICVCMAGAFQPIYPSTYLSIYLSIYLSVCLFIGRLF